MQLCASKLLSLFMALLMSAMLVDASPVQANAAARNKSLVKQSRVPASAPKSPVPASAPKSPVPASAPESPVPSETPVEKARDCDCRSTARGKKGQKYSAVVVQKALDQGMSLKKEGKTVGINQYPHGYGNGEGLKFASCTGGLMEFPVLNRGSASGEAGPDRVVFDGNGNFCGCMTHLNARKRSFRLCT